MEMLAVYFAILDNLRVFRKKLKRRRKIVVIRSDSKSTIEQLNKKTEIRDSIIQRIFNSISRILESLSCKLVFNHLNRTNNTAGKILEHIRKENNCLKVA